MTPETETKKRGTRGMGRVWRRGKIWWVQFSVHGKTYRISSGSGNRADAVRKLKSKIGDVATGKPIAPKIDRLTLGELREIFAADQKLNTRDYRPAPMQHVIDYFGEHRRAASLTYDDLVNFANDRRAAGASASTIRGSLVHLHYAMRLAVRSGSLGVIPEFPAIKVDNARQGFIEPTDFVKLRAALPDDLKDPIEFLWLTAWRFGEMTSLEWRDVFADVIRLRSENSKNHETREFPLTGELKDLIERARAHRDISIPFVFHRFGERIRRPRKCWPTAAKEIGRQGLLVHDLRRSAIRELIRSGVSEPVAMKLSGHKTASVFQRYNITSADDKVQAVERRDAHLKRRLRFDEAKVVSIAQ